MSIHRNPIATVDDYNDLRGITSKMRKRLNSDRALASQNAISSEPYRMTRPGGDMDWEGAIYALSDYMMEVRSGISVYAVKWLYMLMLKQMAPKAKSAISTRAEVEKLLDDFVSVLPVVFELETYFLTRLDH